jgi:hypothetical protein
MTASQHDHFYDFVYRAMLTEEAPRRSGPTA